MENYYFTFGYSHKTMSGVELFNVWVRVVASDFDTARTLFIEKFSSIYMEKPDKWAFQYNEEQMDKRYFPAGEYALIEQDKKEITLFY